ncbi:hypothetical protein GQ457_03G018110 [Hibiscus cannabinus]
MNAIKKRQHVFRCNWLLPSYPFAFCSTFFLYAVTLFAASLPLYPTPQRALRTPLPSPPLPSPPHFLPSNPTLQIHFRYPAHVSHSQYPLFLMAICIFLKIVRKIRHNQNHNSETLSIAPSLWALC